MNRCPLEQTKVNKTRSYKAGEAAAKCMIEHAHLMYNKRTSRNFIIGLMNQLEERRLEFK